MDLNLVERARAGDELAFEALTVTWHPRLFRLAHGIVRDPALAEDATQRAFLEVWRWLPRLHEPARFEGWATGHLVRACRSSEAGRADADEEDPVAALVDDYGVGSLGGYTDRGQLSRGFRQLAFDDRAVLVLRFLAELDATDAGLALELEADTIEARVDAALEALDRSLDGDATPVRGLKPQMEGA